MMNRGSILVFGASLACACSGARSGELSTRALPSGHAMTAPTSGSVVGELMVNVNGRLVAPETPVRAYDRIQFAVTSSQPGWLFLYHGSATSPLRRLWPEDDTNRRNYVQANYQVLMPSDGYLEVDDTAEDERFYAVIVGEPGDAQAPPSPAATKAAAESPEACAPAATNPRIQAHAAAPAVVRKKPLPAKRVESAPKNPTNDASARAQGESAAPIVQIAVRGGVSVPLRGITFRQNRSTPAVSFRAEGGSDRTIAAIEFSLTHVAGTTKP